MQHMSGNVEDPRTGIQLFSPAGPEFRPEWDQRLVVDFALGTTTETILEVHNLQSHQFDAICRMPTFVMAVADLKKSLEKDGATFKFKAGLQVDSYLSVAHSMITDPEMDPRVRTRLIEDMARWAGYDQPAQVGGGATGRGFEINIQFGVGGNRSGLTIDADEINGN
jgi:hypothetical protein